MNVTFYMQLFLELSNFISSHHYDALIHKALSHDELRFVKFHILARVSFLSPSEGRAGPSRRSHTRTTPSSLALSHNSILEDFFVHRGEAPSPTPWSGVQGVPCSRSNEGSSPTNTEARRHVLLVEMIPKVEERGFRSVEKRDQRFFP